MLNLFFPHSPTPFLCPWKHPCSECRRDSIKKTTIAHISQKRETSRALCTIYVGVRGEETQNITRFGRSVPGNPEGCLTFSRQARQSPCASRESFCSSGKFREGFGAGTELSQPGNRRTVCKPVHSREAWMGRKETRRFFHTKIKPSYRFLHSNFFWHCPWWSFVRKRRKNT